jgi:hypothetical protein
MDSQRADADPRCSFDVREIGFENPSEENVVVVGLAEYPAGGGRNLIFQRSIEFDDQDRALGMDTYCLTVETGAIYYGGVTGCVLDGALLTIGLEVEASIALGVGVECELHLLVGPDVIARLADRLRMVLGGGPIGTTRLIL